MRSCREQEVLFVVCGPNSESRLQSLDRLKGYGHMTGEIDG